MFKLPNSCKAKQQKKKEQGQSNTKIYVTRERENTQRKANGQENKQDKKERKKNGKADSRDTHSQGG